MRTKKFLPAVICLFVSLTAIIVFASCAHTHSFGEWSTLIEPTCSAKGIKSRICDSCGYPELSSVDMVAHTEEVDAAIEPSCSRPGKTEGSHCSVCFKVIREQEVIDPLSHTEEVDTAISATCTEAGKSEGKHCSVCGTVIIAQEEIPSAGHKFDLGLITTSPTCQAEGEKTYRCTVSGCSYSYKEAFSLPQYSATELYEKSIEWVGEINTYDKNGDELALATGFVISSDGKIVTNYHVLDGALSADFTINEKTYEITSVLAYDADIDLVVVKIDAENLSAATICKESVHVGETVYAIGSSRGMTNTYSQGIISYANREIDGVSHIQHDASITNGNSGGPLINSYGEVIGINSWLLLDSQNLNFAVFSGELDNLVYGDPLTVEEFYKSTRTPADILVDLILSDGEYDEEFENIVIKKEYEFTGYNSLFALFYDYDIETVGVFLCRYTNSGDLYATFISLDPNENGLLEYAAEYRYYSYDEYIGYNNTSGYIDPNTFTKYSSLTYEEYDGAASHRNTLLREYTKNAVDCVNWLKWCLKTYDIGLTIEDFGFTAYDSSK